MPRRIQKIEDITGLPEIGKSYLVRCLLLPYGAFHEYQTWAPVIGPVHEDADFFAVKDPHYHFDWRFWTKKLSRQLGEIDSSRVAYVEDRDMRLKLAYYSEYRRMRCIRQMPTEWPALSDELKRERSKAVVRIVMRKLNAAYAGCTLNCMRCPHKGIKLDSMPVVDGVVTCPGHGLRWNVTSGALVIPEEYADERRANRRKSQRSDRDDQPQAPPLAGMVSK